MTDLELLHTSLAKLQRLRIVVGACALVATCLGSYVIVERSSAYRALIIELRQQQGLAETERKLRAQDIETVDQVLQQQLMVRRQQQQLIQSLRAIGLTASQTTHYTQARTEGDSWRLYGRALEQSDVFLLMAQLRRLLPESVVTLVHISGSTTQASGSAAVTFEIFARPATG